MESFSTYYREESYFVPNRKYLDPQAWVSCDEQQRLFHYHYNQNKRGLSYASRSTPLHDLSRLPQTPERHEDFPSPKNGVNSDIFYGDGRYCLPPSAEWVYGRPEQNGHSREDVTYNGNRYASPRRSKSKERSRKALDHYEHSALWNVNPEVQNYDDFLADGRRQNVRYRRDGVSEFTEVPPASSANYYDVYRDPPRFPQSDNSGTWQPWSDMSRPIDRSAAMSPSSPLDSGLSSQSVASTPNSELEPLSNWDQTSGNGDWFQRPYTDNRNVQQCSCPSEKVTTPLQTTMQQGINTRRNLNRSTLHPLSHSSQNNFHHVSKRVTDHRDTNSSFSERTSTECKCHSSVESVSDSYELRNLPWTLYSEQREYSNSHNGYSPDQTDSDVRSDRRIAPHSSTASSESTLKGSSANCKIPFPECKIQNESHATYKIDNDQKTDSVPSSKDAEVIYQKQRQKNAKKAEKALCELEEIYNKLNLDDFDLLDRAERRDLPTAHQMMGHDSYKSQPLTRSKSDTFYEIFGREYGIGYSKSPRAPPLRRAGIPDRIADDMALRKQQKPTTKFGKPVCRPPSYLLFSSHFTPSIPPVVKDFPFTNKPDVEHDDLHYRTYFQPKSYHELPQPPFGIPLHPMVQYPNSNYLHATPSSIPRALCHPRGNPDIVRDDMAFRNLRKDNPQRCAPDEIPYPSRQN